MSAEFMYEIEIIRPSVVHVAIIRLLNGGISFHKF